MATQRSLMRTHQGFDRHILRATAQDDDIRNVITHVPHARYVVDERDRSCSPPSFESRVVHADYGGGMLLPVRSKKRDPVFLGHRFSNIL